MAAVSGDRQRTKGITVQQLGGVQALAGQMVSDEFVMGMYCLVTFTTSGLLFGFRKLLLLDSANSRLSKAAEYVRPIEVWYGGTYRVLVPGRE